ncbi:MAG: hypothetical protein JWO50_561 [Candidatus Kaiserbacteria bacterium]|nr:hypothetical protein [Candidatus Kaiserbacteria bacterium]
MPIYNHKGKHFKAHVHPSLQRRIRIFIVISILMLLLVAYDISQGILSFPYAIGALVVGGVVGIFTSRIFHLSWEKDGSHVVGRIDKIGWIVLALYIAFEIARSLFFQYEVHIGDEATAITYAFVSAALLSRVFGLRGRIITILKQEQIFG